jgi:hypothetical protein
VLLCLLLLCLLACYAECFYTSVITLSSEASVTMLNVVMQSVVILNAECCYAEC